MEKEKEKPKIHTQLDNNIEITNRHFKDRSVKPMCENKFNLE